MDEKVLLNHRKANPKTIQAKLVVMPNGTRVTTIQSGFHGMDIVVVEDQMYNLLVKYRD